jgi:outer membrane protein TolC
LEQAAIIAISVRRFASKIDASESNRSGYAIGEKGRPAVARTFGAGVFISSMHCSLKFSRMVCLYATIIAVSVAAVWGQATGTNSPAPTVSLPGSQSPYLGSAPPEKSTNQILQIDFNMAIDLGLQYNLGLLLSVDQSESARGQRWRELSNLLPNVGGSVTETAQTVSLVALGFNKLGPFFAAPGSAAPRFPAVIPAFNYFDMRLALSQSLFNFKNLEQERASVENVKAAEFNYKDARELVVLAVGNAYLQAISDAARVETAEAQINTAQTLYTRAVDQQKAGVTPSIDTLRAQVELQTRQQQLILARNDLAKQRLTVARVIGLAPGQEFVLTEKAPYEELTPLPLGIYLQQAYTSRADYKAATAQVRAAEFSTRAAAAGRYPSVDVSANVGEIGVNPAQLNSTWQVSGGINIPIFAGNRVHSDELEANAQLKQARQQLANLRGQIDYEVRTSLLDLQAAADQVQVAKSSVDLAEQTLTQSQDRFAAGVADNLEVVQAQESVASAHESYIESLYAHNLAKVELARSIGDAEQGVKRYLKGMH